MGEQAGCFLGLGIDPPRAIMGMAPAGAFDLTVPDLERVRD